MELALNLAWLIIAIASYARLFRPLASRRTGPARGPSRCHCAVALSCVLAIFFPVISLTDDLHEMQATLEEPSSPCMLVKKCGVSHSSTPIRSSHQLLYLASSFGTGEGWVFFGNFATRRTAHLPPGLSLSTFGRAPPTCVVTHTS